jgi:cytochrome c553
LPSREPRGRKRRPRRIRKRASRATGNSPKEPGSSPISRTARSCTRPAPPATGPDGRGTEDGEIPAIAGQHGSVLLKQLTDFRHEQRWNERMQNFTDRHHLPARRT